MRMNKNWIIFDYILDFHVIKLYHDLCQTPIKSEDMLHSDQQVRLLK